MKHNIFWFNVSMDHLISMQLINSLTDLPHDSGHFYLGHRLKFFKLFEELTTHS